jgi:hypothetical protein
VPLGRLKQTYAPAEERIVGGLKHAGARPRDRPRR